MIAVHIDRVSVAYGAEPIFSNLLWEIHTDRCVGLVGPNGCGKSSLLRLIAGEQTSPDGRIIFTKGLTIGYLHQEPNLNPESSIWEETSTASTALAEIEQALTKVEANLALPEIYGDEKQLIRALAKQERLLLQFEQLGGHNYTGRIISALTSLGFEEQDFTLPISALSGGQKKLVGLAKLIITQPDLLLLDEPDNHLDLERKSLLEQFIRNYKGAVVIVSHDRYLLDLVADEIAELENGKLTRYTGNYSEYVFEKELRFMQQQHIFEAQQKEINRLEQSAKRLLTWGKIFDNEKFSRRGQSMLKRIEKIDRHDQPWEQGQMQLELTGGRGSKKVLEISDLSKIFPATDEIEEHIVLLGLDLLLLHGRRVGLVGENGAGKSLLFRLILGLEEPTSGEIKIGPSCQIGYYAQEHETLNDEMTLLDTIRHHAPLSENAAVSFLGRFLFNYQQAQDLVGNLSGGERSRMQLALLMLSKANFLILDEPTNNLDIRSIESLENALSEFKGTLLVISHDRYFLDRTVDFIIEIEDGMATEYTGNYSDYLSTK